MIELGIRWLANRLPPPADLTVVHGDYRIGNVIVGPEGLRAVIDWELTHVGDPMEDVGWLCVRAWRFATVIAFGPAEAGVPDLSAHAAEAEVAVTRGPCAPRTIRFALDEAAAPTA